MEEDDVSSSDDEYPEEQDVEELLSDNDSTMPGNTNSPFQLSIMDNAMIDLIQ